MYDKFDDLDYDVRTIILHCYQIEDYRNFVWKQPIVSFNCCLTLSDCNIQDEIIDSKCGEEVRNFYWPNKESLAARIATNNWFGSLTLFVPSFEF